MMGMEEDKLIMDVQLEDDQLDTGSAFTESTEPLIRDFNIMMQVGTAPTEFVIEPVPELVSNKEEEGKDKVNSGEDKSTAEGQEGNLKKSQEDGDKGVLKARLLGFDEYTEKMLYPLVDKQSMLLFEVVQELELSQFRAIADVFHAYAEPSVPVDRSLVPKPSASQIKLRILRMPTIELNDEDDDGPSQTLKKPLELGWKREIHLQPKQGSCTGDVIYFSPDGTTISSLKEMSLYLKKNNCSDLSLEDFSFFAQPIGVKDVQKEVIVLPKKLEIEKSQAPIPVRRKRTAKVKNTVAKISSARRSVQPPKRYATGETSLHPEKRSRGEAHRIEMERESMVMTMGMLPPKYPRSPDKQTVDQDGSPTGGNVALKKRGRPPKIREMLPNIPIQEDDDEGDGLFQISALQFSNSILSSFQGIPEDDSPPRQSMPMPAPPQLHPSFRGIPSTNLRLTSPPRRRQKSDEELLPCSIRCAGMTGEVPTLQCKRCLCLYHPECIGMASNLNFVQFLCSNCDKKGDHNEKQPDTSIPPPPPLLRKMPELKKWGNTNSGPKLATGQLGQRRGVDNSGFQAIGQGGMSVKRLDPVQGSRQSSGTGVKVLRAGTTDPAMSISAVSLKKGRGGKLAKPNKLVLPQRGRNIAPISIPIRGPRPQVPHLHIHGSHSYDYGRLSLDPFPAPVDRKMHKINMLNRKPPLGTAGGLVPHMPRKIGPPPKLIINSHQIRSGQLPMRQVTIKRPPVDNIRRYPQGVIMVGSNKYIVVPRVRGSQNPRKPRVEIKAIPAEESMYTELSNTDVGTSDIILAQIFPYLSVRDLLSASRVNMVWNKMATKPELWRTVRMKNTHIFDVDRFSSFLAKHGTKMVDLRKMSLSPRTDFSYVFKALSGVTSLTHVIIGSSTTPEETIVESFRKECPTVELSIL